MKRSLLGRNTTPSHACHCRKGLSWYRARLLVFGGSLQSVCSTRSATAIDGRDVAKSTTVFMFGAIYIVTPPRLSRT